MQDTDAKRWGAEVRVIGDLALAPPAIRHVAAKLGASSRAAGNTCSVIHICFAYT